MDRFEKNLREFDRQLSPRGLALREDGVLKKFRPDGIVIAGMGGSGLAGELIADLRQELGIRPPIFIWKDYGLPAPAFLAPAKHPLFIFVSFSGNTEETLSGMKAALRKRHRAAAVTTGGELARLALRARAPLLTFSAPRLTPREAVGRMFYGIIEVLHAAGVAKNAPVGHAVRPERWRLPGRALAQKLAGKLVLIYTDNAHAHLAYLWKATLNETAKTHAFVNTIPEMTHNEIAAFERRERPTAAIILGSPAHPRLKKKFKLTGTLLKRHGVTAVPVAVSGKNEFERTWNSVALAFWTAHSLAARKRVDPQKTAIVDTLKRLMGT